MAEMPTPEHPLKVLTGMSNLMLVQTGKFFQNAASANPIPMLLEKKRIQETAASANDRFHEALDEIEVEILRAKAVMERDLKKLRAKRAEKEKAASILTQPAGVMKNTSSKMVTKKSPSAMEKDTIGVKQEDEPAQKPQPTDESKADRDTPAEEQKADLATLKNEPVTINGLDTAGMQAVATTNQPIDLDPSAGLAINLQPDLQVPKAPTPKAEEPASKPSDQSQPAPAQNTPEAPQSQQQDPAPFESMFTDLEHPSGPTSLDFDLGFPPTSTDAPDLLMDDSIFNTMPAAPTTTDDQIQIQPQTLNTTAEDIDTLLPGLDNYVNDPADFSMLDLSIPTTTTAPENTTTAAPPPPAQNTNNDAAPQQLGQMDAAPSTIPLESSFDDLFGGSGDWGAMDDEMGGDGGTLGDFDEDWFRTDV
ncbi:MAG: hypothetical protein Q9195_002813 [Heterodermia aff. obscurata]